MGITDVSAGTVKVKIAKNGIESGEKTVTVNKIGTTAITYTVTANGTADTETSTQLDFTFSAAVSGLTAENVTITAGTGAASKETMTGSGTNWSLGITDVWAGTIKVVIAKNGIESGEKTVTVYEEKDTTDGSSKEQAISLSITQWKNGSVATGEAKWYKFEAESGTSYSVQWKDKDDKPVSDSYTAQVKVTAYQSNGTTNISTINEATSGWTTPKTVSWVYGTVYLKVEPISSASSHAGTYAIRFFDPAIVVPQVPITVSSASATPGPIVVVSWDNVSGASGYRVYRSSTETGEYTKIGSDITGYLTASYTDTNVSAGNTYWYKVAAYNSVGEGDKSDAKQSDTVPNKNVVTSLTIGAAITGGTISTTTQADWYKFTAVSGTIYSVQWADRIDKPSGSTYTGDIKVSAFTDDGTTPVTGFQNIDAGWTIPKTISGVSGTVYLKVVPYSSTYGSYGTYGIKVTTDGVPSITPTSLVIGAAITGGTLSTATQVDWYKFTALSGTTYKVQWADRFDKPSGSAYTVDIKVSAFTGDGTFIISFQSIDSGWTTPKTISGVSGTVYLKVELCGSGSITPGTYGIKVTGETSLTIGAAITTGTISTITQVDWYTFTAVKGTSYYVQWADSDNKPSGSGSTYTGDITVSAFTGDGTTPITSFQDIDSGWTIPKTISGASGTVYLKVEPYAPNSVYLGTYGIRVYQ